MKITAIKGFPVWVGFRNQFIVKVETDAGISGLGEGGISGRELAMQGLLDHVRQFLVGEDPRRIEPFAADIEIAVITMRGAAVNYPPGAERAGSRLPQPLHVIVVAACAGLRELRRGAEADT